MLMGLYPPARGEILVDGVPLAELDMQVRLGCGRLLQCKPMAQRCAAGTGHQARAIVMKGRSASCLQPHSR